MYYTGSVTLNSNDPHDKAQVVSGYLTDKRDVDVLIKGIRLSRNIAQTKAFDKYRGKEVFPGESLQSDAELEEYIHGVRTYMFIMTLCLLTYKYIPVSPCVLV